MSNLYPGELIVFHGLTRGARGLCMVVSVLPSTWSPGKEGIEVDYPYPEVTVVSQHLKVYSFLDEDPEGTFWDRISDRQCM